MCFACVCLGPPCVAVVPGAPIRHGSCLHTEEKLFSLWAEEYKHLRTLSLSEKGEAVSAALVVFMSENWIPSSVFSCCGVCVFLFCWTRSWRVRFVRQSPLPHHGKRKLWGWLHLWRKCLMCGWVQTLSIILSALQLKPARLAAYKRQSKKQIRGETSDFW